MCSSDLGMDAVAKSQPDGYTIGLGNIGAMAITRHMVAKLPYDVERDFQPIALLARGQLLLAVSLSSPFITDRITSQVSVSFAIEPTSAMPAARASARLRSLRWSSAVNTSKP